MNSMARKEVAALPRQRSLFALVRSQADLEQARREMTGLLAIIDSHDPSVRIAESLLGIWVDAQGSANMPAVLEFPGLPDDRRSLRVVEAMGINGIWMLCFLETPAGRPSRADLLASLLDASGYDDPETVPGRFIPVVGGDLPSLERERDTALLHARFANLLLPAVGSDLLPLMPAPQLKKLG